MQKKTARHIGIPHYTVDFQDRFKEAVIDDFVETYLNGETPIPCVKCNQTVKFDDLLKMAQGLDADMMVTGHYARTFLENDVMQLHQARDLNKDQSYFLFSTTQQQLNFLRFPLGDFTKQETRQHASRLGLRIADKKESQDICFVSSNYKDFISKIRPNSAIPGDIVDITNGSVLGRHNGIVNYTIGQRRGIKISYTQPLYVVKLDKNTNTVFVGTEDHLYKQQVSVHDINWLYSTPIPLNGLDISVKLRHGQEPIDAKIYDLNQSTTVELMRPERAITPGQACVFYLGSRVIGGGWIEKSYTHLNSAPHYSQNHKSAS